MLTEEALKPAQETQVADATPAPADKAVQTAQADAAPATQTAHAAQPETAKAA